MSAEERIPPEASLCQFKCCGENCTRKTDVEVQEHFSRQARSNTTSGAVNESSPWQKPEKFGTPTGFRPEAQWGRFCKSSTLGCSSLFPSRAGVCRSPQQTQA